MIEVYFETDEWKYDTGEGTMVCPPFVQTVGDIHSYFGSEPHEIVGPVPLRLRSTRAPRMADWHRRRTLADDGFIEFLGRAEQDTEEERADRARKRLEVSLRERKEYKEKTILIGRRSVIPLYHCYGDDGRYVAGYNTLREAAEAVGRTTHTLRSALSGGWRKCAGMRWIKTERPARNIGPFVTKERKYAMPSRDIECSRYDLEGRRAGTWPSYLAAAKDTGISRSAICSAVNGRIAVLEGFRWRKGGVEAIEPYEGSPKGRESIECSSYDDAGNRVATYPSYCRAAKAAGVSRCTIASAAVGITPRVAGLRWRKGHDEKIEPERANSPS